MQMHARFMDACQQIGKIARQHCGEQRGNNYAPLHRHVQPLEDVCTQVRACISARVQQACLCAWTRRYASTRMRLACENPATRLRNRVLHKCSWASEACEHAPAGIIHARGCVCAMRVPRTLQGCSCKCARMSEHANIHAHVCTRICLHARRHQCTCANTCVCMPPPHICTKTLLCPHVHIMCTQAVLRRHVNFCLRAHPSPCMHTRMSARTVLYIRAGMPKPCMPSHMHVCMHAHVNA